MTYTEQFVNYWNAKKTLHRIRVFNKTRRIKLSLRMKEKAFLDNWREVIDKIAASKFCTGGNDRKWRADVSWLLANDDNYVKVLEGKYDGEKIKQRIYCSYCKVEPAESNETHSKGDETRYACRMYACKQKHKAWKGT